MTAKKITFDDVWKWASGKGGFATVFLSAIAFIGSNAESYITKAVQPVVESQMKSVVSEMEKGMKERDSVMISRIARGMARLEIRIKKPNDHPITVDDRIKRNMAEKQLTEVYLDEMGEIE